MKKETIGAKKSKKKWEKKRKMKNEKIKYQKNLETQSDPNIGKRILKISNTPTNSNPTEAKNK